MELYNIIAAVIIIVGMGIIVGIQVYRKFKKNKEMTFEQFVDEYGDAIIKALQNAILVLQVNVEQFEDRDSYEKAIISLTIDSIKTGASDLGIDMSIVNLFDDESLTTIVHAILNKNSTEAFSVLEPSQIAENEKLYDEIVVKTLSN